MRKWLLVLELAPVTSDLLPFATTDTTAITRTLALLMATTVLTTLWAACLSALAHGSMASTVLATVAVFMAGATTGVAIMAGATTGGPVLAAAALADGRALQVADPASVDVAAQSAADRLAVASEAALVASTGAVGSTAAPADSTAVVGRMVVEATAAGTGKT